MQTPRLPHQGKHEGDNRWDVPDYRRTYIRKVPEGSYGKTPKWTPIGWFCEGCGRFWTEAEAKAWGEEQRRIWRENQESAKAEREARVK